MLSTPIQKSRSFKVLFTKISFTFTIKKVLNMISIRSIIITLLIPVSVFSIERVSISSTGEINNGYSLESSVNEDGNMITFVSAANNLDANDTNGYYDVFLHNKNTNKTTCITLAKDGTASNNHSMFTTISADGKYVAFVSEASNLTATGQDLFLYNTNTKTIQPVTNQRGVYLRPSISDDGRYVAFYTNARDLVPDDGWSYADVFIYDRVTTSFERIPVGIDLFNTNPQDEDLFVSISGDGNCVAFSAPQEHLVDNDSNGETDVFLYDRTTKQLELVSISTSSEQSNNKSILPSLSYNGRYVTFASYATNLQDEDDTNGKMDIFIRDRVNHTTKRISVTSDGAELETGGKEPSISNDGDRVTFVSGKKLYVYNCQNAQTTILTAESDSPYAEKPYMSKSGNFISFQAPYGSTPSPDEGGQGIFLATNVDNSDSNTVSNAAVIMYLLQ